MKSAYELAMERLEKNAPTVALTVDNEKRKVAEIDSTYRREIAEKELVPAGSDRNGAAASNFDEAETLEQQLAIELRRLQEDCETKKKSCAPHSRDAAAPAVLSSRRPRLNDWRQRLDLPEYAARVGPPAELLAPRDTSSSTDEVD